MVFTTDRISRSRLCQAALLLVSNYTHRISGMLPALAVISICLISFVSIASICKIAGITLPLIGEISWDWLKFFVKLGSLLFG
jgi:hypothetical protein